MRNRRPTSLSPPHPTARASLQAGFGLLTLIVCLAVTFSLSATNLTIKRNSARLDFELLGSSIAADLQHVLKEACAWRCLHACMPRRRHRPPHRTISCLSVCPALSLPPIARLCPLATTRPCPTLPCPPAAAMMRSVMATTLKATADPGFSLQQFRDAALAVTAFSSAVSDFAIIKVVPAAQRAAWEAAMTNTYGFPVTLQNAQQQPIPVNASATHFVVEGSLRVTQPYLSRVIGLDLSSDPKRNQAAQAAYGTTGSVSSAPFAAAGLNDTLSSSIIALRSLDNSTAAAATVAACLANATACGTNITDTLLPALFKVPSPCEAVLPARPAAEQTGYPGSHSVFRLLNTVISGNMLMDTVIASVAASGARGDSVGAVTLEDVTDIVPPAYESSFPASAFLPRVAVTWEGLVDGMLGRGDAYGGACLCPREAPTIMNSSHHHQLFVSSSVPHLPSDCRCSRHAFASGRRAAPVRLLTGSGVPHRPGRRQRAGRLRAGHRRPAVRPRRLVSGVVHAGHRRRRQQGPRG